MVLAAGKGGESVVVGHGVLFQAPLGSQMLWPAVAMPLLASTKSNRVCHSSSEGMCRPLGQIPQFSGSSLKWSYRGPAGEVAGAKVHPGVLIYFVAKKLAVVGSFLAAVTTP